MNSMVVQVMSGKLYGSIMALEGYSAFHHLLLVLLEEYPELKAQVDETIRGFLKSDSSRHKHEVRFSKFPQRTIIDIDCICADSRARRVAASFVRHRDVLMGGCRHCVPWGDVRP